MGRISKTLNQTLPPWVLQRLNRALQPMGVAVPSVRPDRQSTILDNCYKAEVVRIHHETPRAITIEFELLEGYRLNFKAGQFVTLTLPMGATFFQRCYSFSSATHENNYTITVQRIFQGRVSSYLKSSLGVGDQFYIDDPAGDFVLPAVHPENQRYVFIAAGAGIVPVYSLIKELLGKNPDAEIQLLYAIRSREQAIFARQLARLEAEHVGLTVLFQYTRKEGDGHDPFRRLDGEKILSRVSDSASALFYLCGPYGLVKKCSEAFARAGIPASRIKIENFNSAPDSLLSQQLRPRALTFLPSRLLRKMVQVRQRKVDTILESAHRAGVASPQKCTVGNCQTCKVKVKSGSVLMDEPNSLSIEDARQGYILSCVSYPCDSVVVKLSGN
ncbi:MAG: iron-sulfur cluster-binding domain-containing protein [Ketobacter sp.]